MNRPFDAHRSVPPTVREIAELTARLRDLRGLDVDAAERAAFLADKEALIARIVGSTNQGVTLDEAAVAEDGPDADESYVAISHGEVPLADRVASLHEHVANPDRIADLPDPYQCFADGDADEDAGWSR